MRNRIVPLVVAGVLLLSWTAAYGSVDESLEQAKRLYSDAKFYEAIELLINTVESADLDAAQAQEAYLLLAKSFYAKENQDEAKLWLGKLRTNYPCMELDAKLNHRHFMNLWYSVSQDSLCEREDPGIQQIAVVDFRNNSPFDHDKWTPMQFGIADIMISDLKKLTKLRVVDRERIQMLLDEIQVQQTEYFDESTAVRVGKLLGVNAFVMGSFMQLDKNTMMISPKLVKTETGEILHSETIKGKPDKLMDMLAQSAELVAHWLDVEVTEQEKKELHGMKSESLEAALAYARGVNYEDEQKYAQAYEEYQKALAADSSYYMAEDRLQALAMYAPGK
jgi:TolB-like protein